MKKYVAAICIIFLSQILLGCGHSSTPESIIESAHQYSIIELRHLLAMDYEKVLPHGRDNMSKRIGFDVEYESILSITYGKDKNTKVIKLDIYHPTIELHGPKGLPLYSTEMLLENQNGKISSQTLSERPFPYQRKIPHPYPYLYPYPYPYQGGTIFRWHSPHK